MRADKFSRFSEKATNNIYSMLNRKHKKKLRKLTRFVSRKREKHKERSLLNAANGVIHVGANRGQEIEKYATHGLDVVWIEPLPQVFEQLVKNTEPYARQIALQALITDCDDKEYSFNVANNNGASSSIFQLKAHKDVWPSVHMTETLQLKSVTLTTLLERESLDPANYQGLILDTQGSELLVLKGATSLLKTFSFIKTEVADFESYEGGCLLSEMEEFMQSNGFREHHRRWFGGRSKTGGRYYNVIYTNTRTAP